MSKDEKNEVVLKLSSDFKSTLKKVGIVVFVIILIIVAYLFLDFLGLFSWLRTMSY